MWFTRSVVVGPRRAVVHPGLLPPADEGAPAPALRSPRRTGGAFLKTDLELYFRRVAADSRCPRRAVHHRRGSPGDLRRADQPGNAGDLRRPYFLPAAGRAGPRPRSARTTATASVCSSSSRIPSPAGPSTPRRTSRHWWSRSADAPQTRAATIGGDLRRPRARSGWSSCCRRRSTRPAPWMSSAPTPNAPRRGSFETPGSSPRAARPVARGRSRRRSRPVTGTSRIAPARA